MDVQLARGEWIADRFQVLGPLGSGGYGEVYLAEQVSVGRRVAVKIVHRDVCADAKAVERFEREARLTSQLRHPNTVVVHDFGWDAARQLLFIAMEFVDGRSLRDVLRESGPLEPGRALSILEQVCGSLQEAHERGLVHRDVKPANVMLTRSAGVEDFVKVIDFGLAKAVAVDREGRRITDSGVLIGSPHYLAPEQAGRGPIDARADVYATAIIAFQMLTGALPFDGVNAVDIVRRQLLEAPPSLFRARPALAVPAAVDDWLRGALSKSPEGRPRDIRAFAVGLRRALEADDGPTTSMPVLSTPAVRIGHAPLVAHGLDTAPHAVAGRGGFSSDVPEPVAKPARHGWGADVGAPRADARSDDRAPAGRRVGVVVGVVLWVATLVGLVWAFAVPGQRVGEALPRPDRKDESTGWGLAATADGPRNFVQRSGPVAQGPVAGMVVGAAQAAAAPGRAGKPHMP